MIKVGTSMPTRKIAKVQRVLKSNMCNSDSVSWRANWSQYLSIPYVEVLKKGDVKMGLEPVQWDTKITQLLPSP